MGYRFPPTSELPASSRTPVLSFRSCMIMSILVSSNGAVQHFEGDRGAERKVRTEPTARCSTTRASGAERVVRVEISRGVVQQFEGEKGAERGVRMQLPNGQVQYYEGERGAERMVRMESANCNVHYYEGEKGAERCVCVVQA